MKKKYNYITLLKIISMFLVILIHSISRAWGELNVNSFIFKELTFVDTIARIGVPIFLMCSGFIFLNRDDNILKIIFKYTLKIYLIFILFNMVYKVIDAYMYKDSVMNFDLIKLFIKNSVCLEGVYHLWYLKIVIITYLLIPVFKFLINSKIKYIDHYIFIVLLFIFIGPYFIKNTDYSMFIHRYGYVIYFYLGYYLTKYKNKICNIALGIGSILAFIYTFIKTLEISKTLGVGNELYLGYNTWNVLVYASFIFIIFSYLEKHLNKEKIISYLGMNNFYIYLIHGLVIGALTKFKVIDIYHYNHLIMLFVNAVIIYVTSLLITSVYVYLKDIFKKKILNQNSR